MLKRKRDSNLPNMTYTNSNMNFITHTLSRNKLPLF